MTEQPAGGTWVDGAAVSIEAATQAAAELLAASRSAVVAGLGTDIAGARAAIALALAIDAAIDHMDADALFANLDVMRRSGWIVTTPLQARTRADTVLLVGPGLLAAWPDLAARLALDKPPVLGAAGPRRLYHLCPGSDGALSGAMTVGDQGDGLLGRLAVLRAIVAGRRTSLDGGQAAALHDVASGLAGARFGVAVWSGAAVETLAIEMLCGLIDDLNRTTRFAGLPLACANGGEGVMQAAAWASGYPVRTGFAGGAALHDPWRFDAQRMVASGEADAALWISAFAPVPPPWDDVVPTVALVAPGTSFRAQPKVVLEVGRPGIDHGAMLFDPTLGSIASCTAAAPRTISSVAEAVAAITAALPC